MINKMLNIISLWEEVTWLNIGVPAIQAALTKEGGFEIHLNNLMN